MIGKNNHYLRDTKDGTKVESYSIKKFKVGAASVVIGASIFLGAGAVAQASEEVSNNTIADNTTNAGAKENVPTAPVATAQPVAKETTKEDVAAGLAAKLGGEVKALDKTKLESYIAEIEGKLADGTYANKTEESVAVLKEELKAAKATLANATTQDEITKAYSKLVTTANTKLKAKPVEKKETPAVDTTNGKETVGKKAENTEKRSESNSIENTGSKDPRNGKALDKNNAFRAETTKTVNNISYTMEFSDEAKKEIYLYNEEEANVDITVNSAVGDISSVKVRGGGNRPLNEETKDSAVQTDGFGWSYKQTVTATPGPVTMNITGKPNEAFKTNPLVKYTKTEDQNSVLGERYLVVADTAGGSVSASSNGSNQPGYFKLVVKSQTYKYDIQLPESNADKIGVSNVESPTEADITKIKNEIKIKYSDKATTEDARLASKNGEVLADKSTVVQDVAVAGGTVTVTYKDGSVDTTPVSSVARTNETPTVSIPFSDRTPDKKDIYIYNGEEVDIDITFNDDSGKIQSAALKRGGNIALKDIGENKQDNEWGLVTTVIKNETTTPATIKITGTVKGLTDNQIPKTESQAFPIVSRFATATDLDGAYIENQATKFNAGTNVVSESYKTDPGAFTITLKAQTAKYDVAEPTAKISVANPNSITEAELENIKNNISLEYSKNNNDARLADKKGERVTDSTPLIKDVKQDTADANKLVVTYKDGSTDKIDKSKFIKGGPAPTVNTTIEASGSIPASVPSSDSELTGTGTPGATVKVTVKNPETGAVISEKTAVVGEDGTWKLPLEEGLNSNTQLPGANEAARRFFAPKNPVEITQVVNGIESESRAVSVAVGESKILPSAAAKDGESVVAGAKEVTITVPHDAGRSYFFYTNKGATSTTEVALEQSQNGWSIVKNADKATIKSVEKGVSVHTITLTMNENALFQEGDNKLEIISHNGPSSPPSRFGRYKINVTNEKPTLVSKNAQPETTVNVGDTVDPVSLVTAADHEDDKDATLGTKVRAEVISVNGDESVKTVDTTTAGRYEVKYKAVDSQGKESDVLTHTVIVQGPAPTVELPYSNQANKQIYVYTGENTDLTFKGADEKEIKDLYLRGPGDISGNNAAGYGLPTGKVENGEVTGEGSVSEDKTSATIKMTGKTNLAAGKEWTSFIVSKDNDGKLSNTDYRALDVDPNAKEKPGYARFVVKNQTSKYDIATPTEKVAVTDPANVTQDELDKIKEKLQIEYSKNNDDANLAEKKGKAVDAEDAKTKIKSVEKDNAGNLVVTYTDGSKDTRPLSDFVAKNPEVTPVKDPANLTDAEKAKVEEAVKKANPTATKVEVGNDGTTTVTFPDGSTAGLTPEKTAKTADSNALVDPEVTPVKDPANLTDAEKTKVEEAVKKANPTATKVEVGNDGTTTVTFPDGTTKVTPDKTVKSADSNGVKDPAVTPVKDPANLTDAEKAKVADEVKKSNPTAKDVEVGKDGTATVTYPDGSTTTVTPDKTVKSADSNGVKDPSVTPVKDPANLTDAEKAKVADEVKKSNPTATKVEVGKDGTATVTFPDGSTAEIPAAKAVEKAKDAEGVKDPEVTPVKDPANLTDAEKTKVEEAAKKANPTATDVKVGKDGTATVTFPDGTTVVIPGSDLVEAKAANNGSNASNGNAGTDATNGNSNAQGTNTKLGQRLANTGTTETNTGLAGLGLGILGGLLAAARRRKNDKN